MTTDTEWRMWLCSDCGEDDDFNQDEAFKIVHLVRVGADREAGCKVEWCPNCGSHLSFVPWGKVEVTQDGRPQ